MNFTTQTTAGLLRRLATLTEQLSGLLMKRKGLAKEQEKDERLKAIRDKINQS